MHLTTEQLSDLRQRRVQAQAAQVVTAVDQGLGDAERHAPRQRLLALARLVTAGLPPGARLAAADVQLTAQGLDQALAQGAPWRDTRAAALLHAAAALGAHWFIDQRLLTLADRLPALPPGLSPWPALIAAPQGARFQRAARRERHLRPGLRAALFPLLGPAEPTPQRLQPMLWAAFSPAGDEADPTDDADSDPREAAVHSDTPALPPGVREEAQAFVAHARAALAEAGASTPALSLIGVAADLAFGLGRGARWLAMAPPGLDAPSRLTWMKETLRDLAGLQP